MFIKHIIIIVSLLLFECRDANAMGVQEVSNFCKVTSDVDFCSKYIGRDSRIGAARNLNDLLMITVSQCKNQVAEATKELNKVRPKYNGPIGKERINICERNYKLASDLFEEASKQAQKREYAYQAHISILGGVDYMRHCEDEWRKNGPPQKSPLTLYNTNVAKLSSISRKIIDKLPPT